MLRSMPTLNPRITVTLQPQVAAVLRRLSELTKNSQSALVGELLESSLEIFERMVEVLQAAEDLRAQGMKASDEVKESLQRAHGRIETQLGLILEDWDHGNLPIVEAAERVQRRAGGGARSAPPAAKKGHSTPVPVTRGSGLRKAGKRGGRGG
jgi:hypothetical protein